MPSVLTISQPEGASAATPLALPGCPLPAILRLPDHPSGVVVVLHAGRRGCACHEVDQVAAELRSSGLGTLVIDLAPGSRGESIVPSPEALLVERATTVLDWVTDQPLLADLPIGVLGLHDAAAAALAAASASSRLEAVVVIGGEPDRAEEALARVTSPVLLLPTSAETDAIHHHQAALGRIGGIKRIVWGGRERFRWAALWFLHYLALERTWRQARSVGV